MKLLNQDLRNFTSSGVRGWKNQKRKTRTINIFCHTNRRGMPLVKPCRKWKDNIKMDFIKQDMTL